MSKNRKLKKAFNEADRAAINLSKNLDNKIALAYEKALEDIKKKIQAVYDKFGDKPTITEVRKFNRLVNIENEINMRLAELNKYSRNAIQEGIRTQAIHMYDKTISGLKNVGIGFTDIILDKEALKLFVSDTLWYDAMNNNTAKLMSDIKREFETVLRANAREEIISGIAEGKPFREVAKTITERFNVSQTRAKTITFTEMHKAQMFGRNEGIKKGLDAAKRLGLNSAKVWRHNGIGDPRPDHVAADGQYANKDGFFNVGGELLEAPGLGTDPSNNINCHCSAEFEFITDIEDTSDDE